MIWKSIPIVNSITGITFPMFAKVNVNGKEAHPYSAID